MVKAVQSIVIPAESQTWITVTASRHRLEEIEPIEHFYKSWSLAIANGVVRVEPDLPFRVLIANFQKHPQGIVKN